MTGILYAVGVGPGDPELMTLKAVKILKKCPVVAIPHADRKRCTAYQIAVQAVPEAKEKPVVCVEMPMTKEPDILKKAHEDGAKCLIMELEKGNDVALLTLGDATVYASSMYLVKQVQDSGYQTEIINGVPSFCAAAAQLGISLGEQSEAIHIFPGSYGVETGLELSGVKVIMKSGKAYPQMVKNIRERGLSAAMAENCSMKEQKLYKSAEEFPEHAGYYTLMIVRDSKKEEER